MAQIAAKDAASRNDMEEANVIGLLDMVEDEDAAAYLRFSPAAPARFVAGVIYATQYSNQTKLCGRQPIGAEVAHGAYALGANARSWLPAD